MQTSDEQRRFGNRATIKQPGILSIGGQELHGIIENVGLQGAFFVAQELPSRGKGTLRRQGGRAVEVDIVWRCDQTQGVGLRFQ